MTALDVSGLGPGRLGRRGPEVTRVGLGCAPIGNLFRAVTDDEAHATVDAAWDVGIRFFDTAPLYGHGLAEERLGRALRDRPRDDYVLATKVGRLLQPATHPDPDNLFVDVPPVEPVFDFSRDGVLRSIESSLERIGTDRLDVVHVHDPDGREDEAIAGAFPTLIELRDQGVIGAVGCGMNQAPALERFVTEVDLDCVLLAGRYTLLDRQGGERLLPACLERGIGVVIGGVFNSGLLVRPEPDATYDYRSAPSELVERAVAMQRRCAAHGVALASAAIAFVLRHPAVATVVIGARSAAEIVDDVRDALDRVDDELLDELATM